MGRTTCQLALAVPLPGVLELAVDHLDARKVWPRTELVGCGCGVRRRSTTSCGRSEVRLEVADQLTHRRDVDNADARARLLGGLDHERQEVLGQSKVSDVVRLRVPDRGVRGQIPKRDQSGSGGRTNWISIPLRSSYGQAMMPALLTSMSNRCALSWISSAAFFALGKSVRSKWT